MGKWWWIVVLAASLLIVSIAKGHDYQRPDLNFWYDSLRQPDNEMAGCCGRADAYFADMVDECLEGDGVVAAFPVPCFMVAIITDERTVPGRPPIAVGTRIAIPQRKIRKVPSANPTDHNVIFIGTNGYVYCWEPTALL